MPRDEVLETMTRTNAYFMNKWPDVGKRIVTDRERASNIWTRSVYYEGLMELYRIDPRPEYYEYAVRWAEFHDWNLRDGETYTRNADNQCAGQIYLDLYRMDPEPGRIYFIKASIDSMMATDKIDDWNWIDALQMAMPVFARLGVITGDTAYFDRMHEMYLFTRNEHGDHGLYNPEDGLWWRDADFDPPYAEPNGEDCYWSRGNGWVLAALVRVMDLLPEDHPYMEEYLATYRQMCEALVRVQRKDGFWNVSLHDPDHYGGPETSGTALFVYGMAWGINNGILPADEYLPVVTRAWNAMARIAVRPDGSLGYVQSTGKEPSAGQPVTYKKVPDFEDYGLGCFLLAGSQVYQLAGHSSDRTSSEKGREAIAGPVSLRCTPFPLQEVRLLDGPFKHATQLNIRSLLHYEPDRFLAKFRTEAGLEPRAEHYHGWEDATIAGHSLGHYLSACALMFRTSGDARFLERVNYMVGELDSCQQAHGNGYLGAIPDGKRILEEEVGRGIIHAAPFDLNGIWAPFYSMHKIMAGLRDSYRLCDNTKALEVERNLGDWLDKLLSGLSEEQMQEILSCEHGGMNEVLADLYADTGNRAYLDLSRRFHHKAILDPLTEGVDILKGKHANTQIPKLVGLARRYELTGDINDRNAARFFWERVVYHHSYVNGSHGHHEYFGPPDSLNNRLSSHTSESCNVYNMLKLSMHLFTWDASPQVADFYERALFNHILSSQHSGNGRVLYFHSLQMGGHKLFQDPFSFTCCVGTGMENHSKYGGCVFFKSAEELFVTQFVAAELDWKEKGVVLQQVTGFPEEQGTTLRFLNERPVDLILRIRKPSWADERFSVVVNGKKKRVRQEPGSFIRVKGKWKKGDEVVVEIPFTFRLEAMPDNPERVAIMYGPLVMAADLGPAYEKEAGDPLYVPGLVTEARNPSDWFVPLDSQPNRFMTDGVCRPGDVTVRPLYTINDRNYTVYWDICSEEEWDRRLDEIQAWREERELLESRTIDHAVPGAGPGSRDHGFRARNPGFYEFNGQPCVEARQGWFSFDMKVERDRPADLMVVYWTGFPGPRKFEILVYGVPIATENAPGLQTNEKMEMLYRIPTELTASGIATVTFDAGDNYAGPVFGIRTLETMQPQ
jgi:DUF1680 family protein/rhamnogalacturonyl hydrolase YesR